MCDVCVMCVIRVLCVWYSFDVRVCVCVSCVLVVCGCVCDLCLMHV